MGGPEWVAGLNRSGLAPGLGRPDGTARIWFPGWATGGMPRWVARVEPFGFGPRVGSSGWNRPGGVARHAPHRSKEEAGGTGGGGGPNGFDGEAFDLGEAGGDDGNVGALVPGPAVGDGGQVGGVGLQHHVLDGDLL